MIYEDEEKFHLKFPKVATSLYAPIIESRSTASELSSLHN